MHLSAAAERAGSLKPKIGVGIITNTIPLRSLYKYTMTTPKNLIKKMLQAPILSFRA